MSVAWDGKRIRLRDACRVEDAEALLALLQTDRRRLVDLDGVKLMHTAVVQVLLAFRPTVTGAPADPFLVAWFLPLFLHKAPCEPTRGGDTAGLTSTYAPPVA